MSRSTLILAVVAMLAIPAFAGDLGYTYSLPGETTVFSTNFTGLTFTTMDPASTTEAAPGTWWAKGAASTDIYDATNGLLNLNNPAGGWFLGVGYRLPSAINLADGPVSIYYSVKANNAVPGAFLSMGNKGGWYGEQQNGFGAAFGPGENAWNTGAIMTNVGSALDPNPNTYLSADGNGSLQQLPINPAILTRMQAGFEKFRTVATKTSTGTVMLQNFWLAPNTGKWVPMGQETDLQSATTTFKAADGVVDSLYFLKAFPASAGYLGCQGAQIDNVVLTQAKPGDTDNNGAVNGDDYFNAVIGFGAVAPVGNLTDTAGNPNLVYNALTGDVQLDLTTRTIDTYQIKSAFTSLANMPIWESYSDGGLITKTLSELFESNAVGAAMANAAGAKIFDLGNILPTGKTQVQLQSLLSEARWAKGTTLNGKFDLIVVPEPATMSLLVLGAMGLIARRRRTA